MSKRHTVFDRKCSNIDCCNILPFQGLDRGLIDFGDYVVELSWLYEMHTQEILQGTSIHGFVELAKGAYLHTYKCRAILYITCSSRQEDTKTSEMMQRLLESHAGAGAKMATKKNG